MLHNTFIDPYVFWSVQRSVHHERPVLSSQSEIPVVSKAAEYNATWKICLLERGRLTGLSETRPYTAINNDHQEVT
jgi:hypothetical protein